MNQVQDLMPHQRSWIVDTWNQGDVGLVEISEKFHLDFEDLEQWMWKRPGFPGLIKYNTCIDHGWIRNRVKLRVKALLDMNPRYRPCELAKLAGTSEGYAIRLRKFYFMEKADTCQV